MKTPSRNAKCSCGSGKKFKNCCSERSNTSSHNNHTTEMKPRLLDLLRDQNTVRIQIRNILLEDGTIIMNDGAHFETEIHFEWTQFLRTDEELDQELDEVLFAKIFDKIGKKAIEFDLYIDKVFPPFQKIQFFDFRE